MLKGTEKIWDSSIANMGILWVSARERAQLPRYLSAIYQPFWRRELDIEAIDVVAQCLESAGVSAAGFSDFIAGPGRELHDDLHSQFHDNGIYGVPTYVLGDDILCGREHIPYLRWRLRGSRGPAPDIAYELN